MGGIATGRSPKPGAGADEPSRDGGSTLGAALRRVSPLTSAWALGLVVAFFAHARAWTFVCDDAFISFRYARNLVEHGALVFNVAPMEMVEGYTNFLWVLVLSLSDALGASPETASPVLTQLGGLVGLGVATVLVGTLRRCHGGDDAPRFEPFDLIPATLLVATPEFMVWAHGGLETSWAAALSIGAMAAWLRGRLVTAALCAAAAGLTRVDALLPVAVFGLVWLGLEGTARLRRDGRAIRRAIPWRRVVVAAFVFALPLMAHLAWRRAYYGSWVPNTWMVKAHGALLRESYGQAYLEAWVDAVHLSWLLPLLLMMRARHLQVLLPGAAVVGYGWAVGGDFMAYGRFYVVATVLLATMVGWLLVDATRWMARLAPTRARWIHRGALICAVAVAAALGIQARARWAADRAKPTGWLDGKWEGVTAMDRFARVGLAVGKWMHEHLPPDTLLSVGAAGAVPYASSLPVVDAFGLVDPHLSRMPGLRPHTGRGARPGHQLLAPSAYVKRRDPDLLCHVGYRGPRRPSERQSHRAFRRGYTWACIEPDPIPDPSAEGGWLDVGYYCCRRPRGRVVGPFGQEDGR